LLDAFGGKKEPDGIHRELVEVREALTMFSSTERSWQMYRNVMERTSGPRDEVPWGAALQA